MRWPIPLIFPSIFLSLSACDAPLQQFFPVQNLTYEKEDRVIDVRAQFDPIEYGWFLRFTETTGRLEFTDRATVYAVLREDLGAELCGGDTLDVAPGNVVIGFGVPRERYLPDLGAWQLVAHCA